jgi:hypothetical protein
MKFLNRCFMMNPSADMEIITKIVARAIIDSLDHDAPARVLGTMYVPSMVSILFHIASQLLLNERDDLPLVAPLGPSRSKICIMD